LKNDKPNGFNVVINNQQSTILFCQKILKIEGLQSLFWSRDSITTCKLKLLITLIALIKMEWFKASYDYINLKKQF